MSSPFFSSIAVLISVIALILLRLLIPLVEKCLVGRAGELRRGNVDFFVVVVHKFLLLHVAPIATMVTTVTIIILQFIV